MARPQKEGLDYFPVDCHFDDELNLIKEEFGSEGFGIVVLLLTKIYGIKGYYMKWSPDVALLFARYCCVGVNVVKEVISACIRRGLLDRQMYDRYQILTSKGIQKRYAEATERRSSQKIDGRYLLIPIPKNWVCEDNNSVNVDNNSVNVDNNPQSKVNKSKVNNITNNTRVCALFEKLYEAYPRKSKRGEAYAAFEELDPSDEVFDAMIKALDIQKKSSEWTSQGGKFIPGLVRYIKERRWEGVAVEDDIEERILQASKQRLKEGMK